MDKDKDIFSKLVEKAKVNKLTEREQRAMFLAVDTYVENNPIYIKDAATSDSEKSSVKPSKASSWSRPVASPYTPTRFEAFVSSWHIRSFQTVIAVFVIMIFGVGGSSIAAQNSLPGNFLYPIKVNINEGLKAVLLSGPARATYEVTRVKNRLSEAKQLVAQNKMTDEIQDELAVRVSSHVSNVQKDIDTLTQKGDLKVAFEISSDLENSLQEGKLAIAEIPAENISDSADVGVVAASAASAASINEIIEMPLEASVAVRENTEDQISTLQVNDESTKAIALAKFDAVKKIVRTIEKETLAVADISIPTATLSTFSAVSEKPSPAAKSVAKAVATTTAPAPDKLVEVRELISAGEEKLNAGEYDSAFSFFKHAYDLAQQIQNGAKDSSNSNDPDYLGELL